MFARFVVLAGLIVGLSTPYLADGAAGGTIVCAKPTSKTAGCLVQALSLTPSAAPSGYTPTQLRRAYGAAGTGNAKVAVVGAYGDPTIKADLDTYSRTFGLAVMPSCGSAAQTGCFEKVNQTGGQAFPRANAGWSLETALDVETIHGICPGCRIELVEATSASIANLTAAVDEAVHSGAQIVSMSWGGSETASETSADAHFGATNVDFLASSGDSGYGTSWPAASSHVVAVGGTSLKLNSSGSRSSETAWSGAGSGCSKYEVKPSWQHDTACARRSIADVAAVADPATGAAVYSSAGGNGAGWLSVGGTSLAAPLVAGLVGLAGSAPQATLLSRIYNSLGTNRVYDVTAGTNGSCATYFCHAGQGYDGPTGIGAPIGLTAL